jgi:hypothetical protein
MSRLWSPNASNPLHGSPRQCFARTAPSRRASRPPVRRQRKHQRCSQTSPEPDVRQSPNVWARTKYVHRTELNGRGPD